ncbi:MAG: diguanylate cyclase [Pseudomonadota bacterium]
MQFVLQQLFTSVALLVVASFVFGAIYEHVRRKAIQSIIIGLVGGICAALAMTLASAYGGYRVDGRSAIIIVTSFFGGPLGALATVPLPLAMRFDAGGPGASAGMIGILIAAALGSGIRVVVDRLGWPITRPLLLLPACLSPLTLLALFAPFSGDEPRDVRSLVIVITMWSPFATLLFALLVHNELERARERRSRKTERAFLRKTDLEGTDYLMRQIHHHARLSDRYGTHYAFLLISIDDAVTKRAALTREGWQTLRTHVGRALGDTVRDSDICAPVSFDRFGVLMPHTTMDSAYLAAQRLREAVRRTLGEDAPLTVSVGISCVDDTRSPPDVVADAEGALILANARTPVEAIGPVPASTTQGSSGLPRSFPGALPLPAPPVREATPRVADIGIA